MDSIIDKLMYLPGIIIALSFHEFSHAKAADMLGDPTPREHGRVTLNPIAHIDILGFIALMIAGFGWGKPVPVNGSYFKNFKRDEIIVSAAGVTMNLVLAFVFMAIIKLISIASPIFFVSAAGQITIEILVNTVWINLVLMIFNLIPCPPLDGFNILAELLYLRERGVFYQIYEKGPILLLLLIITGATSKIIGPGVNLIYVAITGIFF